MYDILQKKKRGEELSSEDISFFIEGYTKGSIPDYQASALLMAICLKGMSRQETTDLTIAMAKSGDMLDLGRAGGVTADKHSTGGVGDKTTLIVGPIAAACGVKIAKMSGRGLGHTGGTIDKLESIPGFVCTLSEDEFFETINKVGMSVVSQSADLAPADKKLYALRDVTATVDNISLIASSIMSKKLAAGAQVIVLDVKCGNGAFMKTVDEAKELAQIMIDIGKSAGRKMYACISDMNKPLGAYIGNRLEVYEAIKVLRGEVKGDIYDACIDLAALILLGAGKADSIESGRKLAENSINSGAALKVFREFIKAQHGDISCIDNEELLIKHTSCYELKAIADGVIVSTNTELIGLACVDLGGGRRSKEDEIDPDVGLKILHKPGDSVKKGDILMKVYYKDEARLNEAIKRLNAAYVISDENTAVRPVPHAYAYLDEYGLITEE